MNTESRALIAELHEATSGEAGYCYQDIEVLCRSFIALRLRQSAPTCDSLVPITIDDEEESCGPVNVDGTGSPVEVTP